MAEVRTVALKASSCDKSVHHRSQCYLMPMQRFEVHGRGIVLCGGSLQGSVGLAHSYCSVHALEEGLVHNGAAAYRYRTPNLTDIDHQGLHPDQSCAPLGTSSVPGAVPITDDALAGLGSVLALDSCVLTAENFLDQQMGVSTVTTQEHADLTKSLLVGNDEQVLDKPVYNQQIRS